MTARDERCPRCDRPPMECRARAAREAWAKLYSSRAKGAAADAELIAAAQASDLAFLDCGRHEVSRERWRDEALALREKFAAMEARALAAERALAVPVGVEEAIEQFRSCAVVAASDLATEGEYRRADAMLDAARLALAAAIARAVPVELAGLLRALDDADDDFARAHEVPGLGMIEAATKRRDAAVDALCLWCSANLPTLPPDEGKEASR